MDIEISGNESEPLVNLRTHRKYSDRQNKIIEAEDDRKRAAIERRTLQNRIAQRLYRQRKDNRIAELEAQVASILRNKNTSSRVEDGKRILELQQRVKELEAENKRLKEGRKRSQSRDDEMQRGPVLASGDPHYHAEIYPYPPPKMLFPRAMSYSYTSYCPFNYPTSYPPSGAVSHIGIPGNYQTTLHNYHATFSAATINAYQVSRITPAHYNYSGPVGGPTSGPYFKYMPPSNAYPALSAEPGPTSRYPGHESQSEQSRSVYPGSPQGRNTSNQGEVGRVNLSTSGGSNSARDCVSSTSLVNIMIINQEESGRGCTGSDGPSDAEKQGTGSDDVSVLKCSGVSVSGGGARGAFSVNALLLDDSAQMPPS
ncbi:hypothetical protein BCR33DRAFT_718732 [Rhizoclosmatium globosum]|uniref:BZIP domain-containing protein n=1 Tax=Rhizoclosmatium globosum TaxID=329046 RepID=A0A1Y2C3E3_9FUNG|nr:hypothetical protein BCR33DRAFT_718732 [Rhizoclosmatium globosum]|eukprot:ORY41573.1 hypothetical protein BCR33DRAFT_718732 [Rhizoclosmatium globosum]